jgi:hypothetical protein
MKASFDSEQSRTGAVPRRHPVCTVPYRTVHAVLQVHAVHTVWYFGRRYSKYGTSILYGGTEVRIPPPSPTRWVADIGDWTPVIGSVHDSALGDLEIWQCADFPATLEPKLPCANPFSRPRPGRMKVGLGAVLYSTVQTCTYSTEDNTEEHSVLLGALQ